MANPATGKDTNWVEFGTLDGSQALGTYRQVGLHTWKEDSVAKGRDQFEFRETRRDDWSVYLFDQSRKVTLQIDLFKKTILYNEDEQPQRPLYAIRSASTKPNGWIVNRVEHGTAPGTVNGIFKQLDATHWSEQTPDGKASFSYQETGRDDWSVYLLDASRNVRIQLDLHRTKVLYGAGGAALTDLYSIVGSSAKVNGWLVNKVDFGANGAWIAGSYRQSGTKTWVEETGSDGPASFEFQERARDDWSVYLYDKSRDVSLQLDLWKGWVLYSDDTSPQRQLYPIRLADVLPRVGMDSGSTVNWVEYGDAAGNVKGTFIQDSLTTWFERGATGGGQPNRFREVGRDRWSVHLHDRSRNVSIQLDLRGGKIRYSDPKTAWSDLYSILNTRSWLDGWMVNAVITGSGKTAKGGLRQTGWTSWVEDSVADGPGIFSFEETGRDDVSVYLNDSSRGVNLRIDLKAKKVFYSDKTKSFELYDILLSAHRREVWRERHRITSRSSLTEDYTVDPATKKSTPTSVYRTSVTLPPYTTHVDVWASEETTVEINEQRYTIDPVLTVRVKPSKLSRLTISVPANDLQCPTLFLRSNLMKATQKHVIVPDVEVHKKVTGLKDGALAGARQQLGLSTSLTSTDIDNVQRSLQNIARTVQHTYNDSSHGVHHDRAVRPANMEHPHFKLSFAGGQARYTPLSKAEVQAHIQGARLIQASAAQGFWDSIGNFFKQAGEVIVHTAEKVVTDVVDTVEHVGKDIVDTVDHVGEDLIHGDLLSAGKDLVQGGENLGTDLIHGVIGVGGDLVQGATQLAVVTLKLGSDLVQFVIEHTGFVGKALGWLLEKAGAALGKVVGWLLDKIGWGDVIHTHDVIRDSINRKLDDMAGYPLELKKKADKFFTKLSGQLNTGIDSALTAMNVQRLGPQPQPGGGHSDAVEKLEWLLGKFVHYSQGSQPFAAALAPGGAQQGPFAAVETLIQDEIGAGGGKIREAFGDSFDHLMHVFTQADHTAENLMGALLEAIRGVALLGLDIVSKVIDELLDLVAAMMTGLKNLVNDDWNVPFLSDFYEGLTGRKMSFISIASMIVAVPTTLIHNALFDKRPFDAPGAALALAPLDDGQRAQGIVYGCCHLVWWVIAMVNDVQAIGEQITNLQQGIGEIGNINVNFESGEVGPGTPPPSTKGDPTELTKGSMALRGIDLLMGVIAAIVGAPITPGQPHTIPLDEAKDDVFEAPNYWAHISFWFNVGGLFFGCATSFGVSLAEGAKVTKGKLNLGQDVIGGLSTCLGIVDMALMSVIDHADRVKRDALDYVDTAEFQTIEQGSSLAAAKALEANARTYHGHVPYQPKRADDMDESSATAWLSDLKNYREWARDVSPGQYLPNKGFANVMDSFPGIGQLGAMPSVVEATEGLSLIASVLLDTMGHLGQGITYIDLASKDALL